MSGVESRALVKILGGGKLGGVNEGTTLWFGMYVRESSY
jgi:hypothetical protein